MEVPLFPLNTVIFPGGVLPLRIFEPRYLDMVSDCLRSDGGFGVFLIKSGQETGRPAEIHLIGTLCKIVDWTTLPDGLLGITAHGERKLRVLASRTRSDHLMLGQVEFARDDSNVSLLPEFQALAELLRRMITELGPPYSKLPALYEDASWVSARLTELLPLDLISKQTLLEMDDARARLAAVRDAMVKLRYL
jgi:Lon protease-like protein